MKSCVISLIAAKRWVGVLVNNRPVSLNQVVTPYPALFLISGSAPQPRSSSSNLHLKRLGISIRML